MTAGGKAYEIPSRDGLISEDIAICPPVSSVAVQARGTERDLVFDDQYRGGGVRLTTASPSGTVTLTRKTYFGQAFTPRESRVRFNLVNNEGERGTRRIAGLVESMNSSNIGELRMSERAIAADRRGGGMGDSAALRGSVNRASNGMGNSAAIRAVGLGR